MTHFPHNFRKAGLSLVEVTLAIGVFTFAMAILLGLLAPMLTDLSDVLDADQTQAIVNKVEVYLDTYNTESNQDDESPFQEVYEVMAGNGSLALYVYRNIGGQTVVVDDTADIDTAMLDTDPNLQVDRRVFMAVIYPSSVNPAAVVAGPTALQGVFSNIEAYSLNLTYNNYTEGYLALNVEVYGYDAPAPGDTLDSAIAENPPSESGLLLSFPIAITR